MQILIFLVPGNLKRGQSQLVSYGERLLLINQDRRKLRGLVDINEGLNVSLHYETYSGLKSQFELPKGQMVVSLRSDRQFLCSLILSGERPTISFISGNNEDSVDQVRTKFSRNCISGYVLVLRVNFLCFRVPERREQTMVVIAPQAFLLQWSLLISR